MSEPKFDKNYAREKLKLVLRDLNAYTADEFWREINRITSGATGLPSSEELAPRVRELESLTHKQRELEAQLQGEIAHLEAENAELAGALEEALHHVIISPDPVRGDFIQEIEAALAAYRKGGDA